MFVLPRSHSPGYPAKQASQTSRGQARSRFGRVGGQAELARISGSARRHKRYRGLHAAYIGNVGSKRGGSGRQVRDRVRVFRIDGHSASPTHSALHPREGSTGS